MNTLARILIFMVFTLTGAMLGCAQTSPPPPAPSATSNSKDASPPPPPAPAKPVRKVGKAEVYYFPKQNETEGKVYFEVIGKFQDMYEGKDVLQMEVDYKVTGNKATKPESVIIIVSSYSSNGLKYKDNHRISIYVDDVKFRSGDTREWFSAPGKISSETYVTPRLSYDDFLKLIGAKKVEMEFGQTRFTLSQENLEALRDLNRTIEQ
ncbi:MAG: hypothetical protein QOH63_2697 [Acidobacteriota bacterium]|nr:hypothetical protein [Acidobacteriota bacterium]